MGDAVYAIFEDEKAIIFANFMRFYPNFTTLAELCYTDDADMIDWAEFQSDVNDIYDIERVYREILRALNQMRRHRAEVSLYHKLTPVTPSSKTEALVTPADEKVDLMQQETDSFPDQDVIDMKTQNS